MKKRKTSEKYEIFNEYRAWHAPRGVLFYFCQCYVMMRHCRKLETFSETHFGSFKTPAQRRLDEALPFHPPTLTHSWGQRLLAHMSTLWQQCSKVSAMGYPGCVPVVIPSDATSHKLPSQPSRRPLSSRFESIVSSCKFRIPAGVKRVRNTCLNIDKERGARRQ